MCVNFSKQIKMAQVERTTIISGRNGSGSSVITTSSSRDGNNISTSTVEASSTPDALSRGETTIFTSTGPNFRSQGTRSSISLRGGNGRVRISSVSSSSSSIRRPSSDISSVIGVTPESEDTHPRNVTLPELVTIPRKPEEDMGNITFTMQDFDDKTIPKELGQFVVRSPLMDWRLLPIKTQNFYVSYEGDLYAINQDNNLYYYDELRNQFQKLKSLENNNMTLSFAVVTSDKTPYGIDQEGNTYYMNNQTWIQLPGCATMIALGREGEVYKLGCDRKEGGYEVFMLFCTQDDNYINTFPHMQNNSTCNWYRLNGRGMKLSILQNGLPVIINDSNNIQYFTGSKWNPFLGIKGKEISFSNSGLAMVIGLDKNLLGLNYFTDPIEIYAIGTAKKVSIGPYSIPIILGNDDNLYMASNFVLQ